MYLLNSSKILVAANSEILKNIFDIGDKKVYKKNVMSSDVAQFDSETVHQVCSTFSLAQAAEWSSRLFVLEMKDVDEEGIGTMLTIHHKSPALIGDEIEITALIDEFNGNELICSYIAKVNDRVIAEGKTGQKILKKERIEKLFHNLKNG